MWVIAARFPEMDVVPFDTDVTMIDVVLQIPYVTYFIPLFVLVASAAVTVILIGNLVVSLVCVCSAAAIFLEAFCISALMGVILNPFSAAFLVVVAALSVKSSTHICYSFQQAVESDYHRDDAHRLTLAFKRMYIPVVLSTIAGSLVLLPVIATNVAIFRWIAVINVCYLVGGAFHSLLFTPLLLIWMPQTLTGRRFFCTATKQANDVAMKNLNVL
ncbi:unnamed protein product [Heligmosomoides polygyrus]|uniref:SSD domain-containing protein n=1 Tax=Heligmosomoides polygyrus TaxID=6339 RepID=A0A183G6X4_HELPZ|nr:unnamed protein product [Heligmosomoides polygyrus]